MVDYSGVQLTQKHRHLSKQVQQKMLHICRDRRCNTRLLQAKNEGVITYVTSCDHNSTDRYNSTLAPSSHRITA